MSDNPYDIILGTAPSYSDFSVFGVADASGHVYFKLHPDGTVEVDSREDISEAARTFWNEVSRYAALRNGPIFDRAGAAAYLSTSERHIQAMWNRRELPAIKVGRKVRFHKDDLDAYIASNRRGQENA